MRVSTCKYLGVFIDEKLMWKTHIDYVYNKLVKFTSIFHKLKFLLPSKCLKNLYFAFVYPHLLYGIEIYANTNKTLLDKLSKLNNRLVRIVLNEKWSTAVVKLYTKLNVLPIFELHQMQLIFLIYKCLFYNELLPRVFHNYFVSINTVHNYYTRGNSNLVLFRSNMCIGQRCSNFKCSKLWNVLPKKLKIKDSLKVYKKNIVEFLFGCVS